MQLEFEQRRFLNRCLAQARVHERTQVVAQIAAEREAMQQELEALREKLQAQAEDFQKQLVTLRREAALLKEWWQAYTEHQRVKHELAASYRQHMLEEAWAAEFDPLNMVRH